MFRGFRGLKLNFVNNKTSMATIANKYKPFVSMCNIQCQTSVQGQYYIVLSNADNHFMLYNVTVDCAMC